MTKSYRGIQGVTGGYKGLQGGYKRLQLLEVLKGATMGYKRLEGPQHTSSSFARKKRQGANGF